MNAWGQNVGASGGKMPFNTPPKSAPTAPISRAYMYVCRVKYIELLDLFLVCPHLPPSNAPKRKMSVPLHTQPMRGAMGALWGHSPKNPSIARVAVESHFRQAVPTSVATGVQDESAKCREIRVERLVTDRTPG
jgi:hypothetical protein